MCPDCIAKADAKAAAQPGPVTHAVEKAPAATARASGVALTLLGLACLAVGLYFLLNPAVDNFDAYLAGIQTGISVPREVVNIHRLTLGETFTIVGAIFLAAAWRPR